MKASGSAVVEQILIERNTDMEALVFAVVGQILMGANTDEC